MAGTITASLDVMGGDKGAEVVLPGADLVLGSRYVRGGSIPNWGMLRRAVSLGGNLYAQAVLQSRVRDLTGGFKCFRRRVLETIPLDAVDSRGYAFQIETTYRIRIQDAEYWYDKLCGAWGIKNGPTAGFIVAGLDVGGPLAENASSID